MSASVHIRGSVGCTGNSELGGRDFFCTDPNCLRLKDERPPSGIPPPEYGGPSMPMYRHIVEFAFDDPSPRPLDLNNVGHWLSNKTYTYLSEPELIQTPLAVGQQRYNEDGTVMTILACHGPYVWAVGPADSHFGAHRANKPYTFMSDRALNWAVVP